MWIDCQLYIRDDAMAKLNTKIVMLKGEQGKDGTTIKSVEKTASSGLTDTYTITLTDGSKSSFNVTNGKGISSISKTEAIGLDDIYTMRELVQGSLNQSKDT